MGDASCPHTPNTVMTEKGFDFFQSDTAFDGLYSDRLRLLSGRHWTPLAVAQSAAAFLGLPGGRVLDVGCGPGKFCLAAAHCQPRTSFEGVERRADLVRVARRVAKRLRLTNASFIDDDFVNLDFSHYSGIYFYNSFHENIDITCRIDNTIIHSAAAYDELRGKLYDKLSQMPAGTRLATYYCPEGQVPPKFKEVGGAMNNLLIFWCAE